MKVRTVDDRIIIYTVTASDSAFVKMRPHADFFGTAGPVDDGEDPEEARLVCLEPEEADALARALIVTAEKARRR